MKHIKISGSLLWYIVSSRMSYFPMNRMMDVNGIVVERTMNDKRWTVDDVGA